MARQPFEPIPWDPDIPVEAESTLTLKVNTGVVSIHYKTYSSDSWHITSSASKDITCTVGDKISLYATAESGYVLDSAYAEYTSINPYTFTKTSVRQTWSPTATQDLPSVQDPTSVDQQATLRLVVNKTISKIYYRLLSTANWSWTSSTKLLPILVGSPVQMYAVAASGYAYSTDDANNPTVKTATREGEYLVYSPTAIVNTYTLSLIVNSGVSRIYYKINGSGSYSSTTTSVDLSVNYQSTYYLYAEADTTGGYHLDSTYSSYNQSNPYSNIKSTNLDSWSPTATSVSHGYLINGTDIAVTLNIQGIDSSYLPMLEFAGYHDRVTGKNITGVLHTSTNTWEDAISFSGYKASGTSIGSFVKAGGYPTVANLIGSRLGAGTYRIYTGDTWIGLYDHTGADVWVKSANDFRDKVIPSRLAILAVGGGGGGGWAGTTATQSSASYYDGAGGGGGAVAVFVINTDLLLSGTHLVDYFEFVVGEGGGNETGGESTKILYNGTLLAYAGGGGRGYRGMSDSCRGSGGEAWISSSAGNAAWLVGSVKGGRGGNGSQGIGARGTAGADVSGVISLPSGIASKIISSSGGSVGNDGYPGGGGASYGSGGDGGGYMADGNPGTDGGGGGGGRFTAFSSRNGGKGGDGFIEIYY